MSLAYGYDLKDGDKMLEAPVEASKIMTPLVVPGAVLVNYLPFCALSDFHPSSRTHSYFKCDTFLHGFHTSAMNQRRVWLGN